MSRDMIHYRGGQTPHVGDKVLCDDFAMAVTVIAVGVEGQARCTTQDGEVIQGTAVQVRSPHYASLEDYGPSYPAGKLILIERSARAFRTPIAEESQTPVPFEPPYESAASWQPDTDYDPACSLEAVIK